MLKVVRFPGMGSCPVPIVFLLLVFASAQLFVTPLTAAEKKRATVILDLSSSMASPLAGGPTARSFTPVPDADGVPFARLQPRSTGKRSSRITEVKRALGKAYRDFSPRLNLGLVAFGSRTAGSCSDIHDIEPIGPIDPKRYRARTNALKPVGVSPIGDAIKFAAGKADFKNTINSFILITDSEDSCGVNLCKLGGDLRNSGANLTVHVIAIGLSKARQSDLRCLAGHTRGHFFSVSNKSQLTQAVYNAFNGVSIASFLKPEPAPSAETIAAAEKAAGGNVNMTALIVGDIPLPRHKPRIPRKSTPPAEPPKVQTEPPAKVAEVVKNEARKAAQPVIKAAPPPPVPQMTTMVPQQPAVVEKAPSIPEAAPEPETASTGQLSVNARIIKGSAPMEAGILWNVFENKGGRPGQKVAASRKGQPVFKLPDGNYIVQAMLGYSKASATVTVKGGQLTSRDLVFNAGGIKLTSIISGQIKLDGLKPVYTIKNSKGQVIAKNLSSNRIIHLNAGTYVVYSRIGRANSVVTAKISVQPGKLTEATLNHSAGRITFELTKERGGEPFSEVAWKFRRSDGEVVATSNKAVPRFILASGTYKAIAKARGKVYRSSFIVRPGDDKVKNVLTE